MEPAPQNAGVRIAPPLIYLAAIGVGWAIHYFSPLPILAENPLPVIIAGAVTLAGGFGLVLWSALLFKKHGTPLPPWTTTQALVHAGPYRFTRNPMYLGMALIQFGIGLVLNSWWVLILLIPVVLVIQTQVIHKEEEYLERTFGEAYLRYKQQTGRWL